MQASLRPLDACLDTAARHRRSATLTPIWRRPTSLVRPDCIQASSSPSAMAAVSHDFAAVAPADQVQQLLQLPFPPVQPLIGNEKGSFAEETITTRLPAIMDTVLADMKTQAEEVGDAAAAELELAAAAVRQMQADMPVGGALLPLSVPNTLHTNHPLRDIIPTTNAAVAAWQQHMTQQQQQQQRGGTAAAAASWLQLPWLVVECYLYVRLATIIAQQPTLLEAKYDPFSRQKAGALTKSLAAAADIAAAAAAQFQQQQAAVAAVGCGGDQQLAAHFSDDAKQRFYELLQYCLWGNKVDLSLLTDVSHLDVLSSSSSGGNSSSSSNIIVNEYDQLWEYLKAAAAAARDGDAGSQDLGTALPRVDIILDNAGLELFTDLILADYIISTGLAAEVILHGKQLPWFVSDTLDHDLHHLINICSSSSSSDVLAAAGKRWQQHLTSGQWKFEADNFWTTPHPFWWMQELAPKLHQDLSHSSLLIFKGDLNYRKLAGDCRWPPTTPFTTALTGFCPTGVVSLRTLKADVIAGLAPGEAEQMDNLDPRWQVNGKFDVLQFAKPPL